MSYSAPGVSFAVELHKGSWIQVCRSAEDRPASECPDAQRAIAMWQGLNQRKHDALR